MIKSMTAYASEETTENAITVSVEIRCYNSRYLDSAVKLPPAYANLEEPVRQMISTRILRGRAESKIGIKDKRRADIEFSVNENLADSYYNALHNIKSRYGIPGSVNLEHLLKISGIVEPVEVAPDCSAAWKILEKTIARCLVNIERMRESEGKAIYSDLCQRIKRLENYIIRIEEQAGGLLEIYSQRLKGRINELTRNMTEIDNGRIAQEAAFMADRSDISEEVARVKSHLNQFRTLMAEEEPAGKPLNFLLQELLREFNTMGSKAGNAEISHIIVSAKTEIEKIREQVQNVE